MLDYLADVAEPDTYRTAALANDTVKISANTIDTYRSLVKHMKEENVVRHSYQIKTERAYRFVIGHLHHSVPLDDIKEELQKEGHTVRNIMNIKHKQTKKQKTPYHYFSSIWNHKPTTKRSSVSNS